MYAYVIAEQITFGDKFHDKIKLKKNRGSPAVDATYVNLL